MINYFYVMVGSALGGLLRYVISDLVQINIKIFFPIGTLLVNILGSFLIGFIIFIFGEKEIISAEMRLFLTVGLCGGFTTFSTVSYETLMLFKESEFLYATINIILNIVLSLVAIYVAYLISKIL